MRSIVWSLAATTGIALLMGGSEAVAQDGCAGLAAMASSPRGDQFTENLDQNFACLLAAVTELEAEREALAEKVRNLEESPVPGAAAIADEIPRGAVVAFDLQSGCPREAGWVPFEGANARFIIGAATEADLDEGPANLRSGSDGIALTARPFGESRGREEHVLTPDQMPKHNHRISTGHADNWGHDGLSTQAGSKYGIDWIFNNPAPDISRSGGFGILPDVLEETGGDQPHNNMPPYIALHYCKKT